MFSAVAHVPQYFPSTRLPVPTTMFWWQRRHWGPIKSWLDTLHQSLGTIFGSLVRRLGWTLTGSGQRERNRARTFSGHGPENRKLTGDPFAAGK
jgi:hypothetical protein